MIGVGLMSGTSIDAVDAAVVRLDEDRAGALSIEVLAWRETRMPDDLRARLIDLFAPERSRVDDLCEANVRLGDAFAAAAAAALAEAGVRADFVASHGQTVWHETRADRQRGTLQIAAPAAIAERLGVTVVADFRPRDIAAGGEGAPLSSYVDVLLFRGDRPRAVQNIGGIGNVTWVPPRGDARAPMAFDTGPGNVLIDALVARLTGGAERYDRDGARARAGTPDRALVRALLDDPYFAASPPKTTGRELFGPRFVDRIVEQGRQRGASEADLVATATAFTVETIADQYRRFLPQPIDEVIVAGGGALNPVLMRALESALAPAVVRSHDAFGLPAAAREAVYFAILGYQTLHHRASTIPSCTGARHAVVLGSIVPGANFPELMRTTLAAPAREITSIRIAGAPAR